MSIEKKFCDRCGNPLNGCSIMSMYNTDIICMDCKKKEQNRSDYKSAVDANNTAIKTGNYNYKGIGWK